MEAAQDRDVVMVRRLSLVLLFAFVTACATVQGPQLRVLGVQEARRQEVVFVQVTNPARRPMRLTRLEYRFASHGATVAAGWVPLARDVPAGAAVVVEVPFEGATTGELTLSGKLTAELDQIVRIFAVSAQIQPD